MTKHNMEFRDLWMRERHHISLVKQVIDLRLQLERFWQSG